MAIKRTSGLHLGNWLSDMTDHLREVIRRTRPTLILVMDNVRPSLLREALQIKGDMEIVYRPYYDPGGQGSAGSVANYANTARERTAGYLSEPLVRQAYDAGRFLIKPFNETNIGFEGFARGRDGFAKSLDAWHRFVNEFRPHYPKAKIGSIAPTLGNHDAWFTGDDIGAYFFHGVEGCKDNLTASEIQAATASCPMRSMFETADAIFYHSYGNVALAVNGAAQRWYSRRWEQYQLFLPYNKPHYITECDMGYDEVGTTTLSATDDERLTLGHGRRRSVKPWEATEGPPVATEALAEARNMTAQHNRAELYVWWHREVVDKNPKIKGSALWWGCTWGEGDPTWAKHFTGDGTNLYPIVTALENYHGVEQEEKPPMPDITTPLGNELAKRLQARLGNKFRDKRTTLRRHPDWDKGNYYKNVDSRPMSWIVLHYSTGQAGPVSTESINNYHIDGKGWPAIGYHFVIDEGYLDYVGDINTQRAHIINVNDKGLGICFTGYYEAVPPTGIDVAVAQVLVEELDKLFGHKKQLKGHKEVVPPGHTDCPGKILSILPTLRVTTDPVRYDKTAWALEQAARVLRDEGYGPSHDYLINSDFYQEIKRKRDAA